MSTHLNGPAGRPRAAAALAALAVIVTPAAALGQTPSAAPVAYTPPVPAAGPWVPGTPQAVPATSRPGGVGVVTTSPRGRLATWSLTRKDGSVGPSVFAALRADGTLGAPRVLPGGQQSAVKFDRRGRGLVLTGTPGRLSRTSVAADGTPGRSRVVSRKGYVGTIDVDAAGNAAIAWVETVGPERDRDDDVAQRVRVSTRPAGGQFAAPVTLPRSIHSTSDDLDLTVAVGAGGRAVVALSLTPYADGDRRVLAWTGTVRSGFGAPRRLGPLLGRRSTVTATITSQGRSVVVWGTQRGGEEPGSPWVVRGASRARGATGWSSAQTIDPGTQTGQASGYLELADGPAGTTTLAWDGTARASNVANVASGDARGRFAHRQVLTRTGEISGLATRPDGTAVVGWTTSTFQDEEPTGSFAALRPADRSTFGPAEPIPGAAAAPFFSASGQPAFAQVAGPVAAGSSPTITVTTRTAP